MNIEAMLKSLRQDEMIQRRFSEGYVLPDALRLVYQQNAMLLNFVANALEAGQQATAPDGSLTAEVHGQYQEGSE